MNNSLYAVTLDEVRSRQAVTAVGGHGWYQHLLAGALSSSSLSVGLSAAVLTLALLPAELQCGQQCQAADCKDLLFVDDGFRSVCRDWELVCEHEYKRHIVEELYWLGLAAGGLLCSWLCDVCGRKAVLLCSQLALSLSLLLFALSPVLSVLCIAGTCIGLSAAGATIAGITLLAEFVSSDSRYLYYAMYFCGAGLGTVAANGIASSVSSWRTVCVCSALIAGGLLPALLWVDESPRYLAAVAGKYDAARTTLQRVSRYNRKPLFQEIIEGEKVVAYQEQGPEALPSSPKAAGTESSSLRLNFVNTSHGIITVTDPQSSAARRFSFRYLCISPHLRKRILLLTLLWSAPVVGYYVVADSLPVYRESRFFVGLTLGVSDLPAALAAAYAALKAGRKAAIEWVLFVVGVTCWIAEVAFLMEQPLMLVVLLSLARAAMTGLRLLVCVYTMEVCATCTRALSAGVCCLGSALVGVAIPAIVFLAVAGGIDALLLAGTMMLACCLAGLDLPESEGARMDDYVEDSATFNVERSAKASIGNSAEKPNFEQFNEAS